MLKTISELPNSPDFFRQMTEEEVRDLVKACSLDMTDKVPPVTKDLIDDMAAFKMVSNSLAMATLYTNFASLGYETSRGLAYFFLVYFGTMPPDPFRVMAVGYALAEYAFRKKLTRITIDELSNEVFKWGMPTDHAYNFLKVTQQDRIFDSAVWQDFRRPKPGEDNAISS